MYNIKFIFNVHVHFSNSLIIYQVTTMEIIIITILFLRLLLSFCFDWEDNKLCQTLKTVFRPIFKHLEFRQKCSIFSALFSVFGNHTKCFIYYRFIFISNFFYIMNYSGALLWDTSIKGTQTFVPVKLMLNHIIFVIHYHLY